MAPGEAQLEIRLFGGLEIRCGGSPVVFPNSRKARALLAYLIVKAAPQRRDALCDLLWEVTDDPRAALRWCLSKLRPLVNDDEVERLRADRERVTFVATGARVDLYVLRQAVDRDFTSLDVHELAALAETLQAPFLAGLRSAVSTRVRIVAHWPTGMGTTCSVAGSSRTVPTPPSRLVATNPIHPRVDRHRA
jgi:DNA-binding SARP family transcriptional activator